MIKNFLLKQMLKRQMKDVPDADIEKFVTLVENNPDLFRQIAEEIQTKMKEGKDQMAATMEVMKAHEDELKAVVDKK